MVSRGALPFRGMKQKCLFSCIIVCCVVSSQQIFIDMKRLRRYLPLLALLLMLAGSITSCRDTGVRDALQRAEALMESDPHAARAVLDSLLQNRDCQTSDSQTSDECLGKGSKAKVLSDSLQSVSLKSKKDAALYALLRTQADYKCRVRLTSDSLIRIATDYYGTRRKTQRAALAQYYLGCTYKDIHRDVDAIDALLRATTLFPDTTYKYYAYSLFELGKEYLKNHMNDNALETFELYRSLYACRSDSVNLGYVDYYMGLAAAYNGEDNKADSLFHCVIRNHTFPIDYRIYTYFELAKLYFNHLSDVDKALEYINCYCDYFQNEKDNGATFALKANILLAKDEPIPAYENYQKALKNSSDIYTLCTAYKGLTQVSSLIGKTDSTSFFVNQYTTLLDSIYSINRQQEIAEIQNSHVIELHDQQLKARHTRFLLLGGLFFVVAFSAFAITLLLNDRKRKNERLRFEQELRDIKQRHIDQSIKEETEADSNEWEESNDDDFDERQENNVTEVKESIPVSHYLSIQQERIALYRKEFADSRWKRFLEERKLDILSKKFMPMDEAEKFKEYLENLFADVFLDMVNENSNVTRQDIEYCAMTMLGFSTAQISYCARVSLHSLHNRRYHIKDKLTSDWYMLVFGSPK